jgi:hypothetical protein
MEKISDLWKSIKERVTNPLFSSFVIAWIFCNWKIPIALFWYDPVQIKAEGFSSIYKFIYYNTNCWDSLWLPILLAGAYTFFMPFGRLLVSVVKSVATTWTYRLNLGITKESSIPMRKFLNYKAEYDKRTAVLEKIIEDESNTNERYQEEQTKRIQAEAKNLEIVHQLVEANKHLDALSDISIIQGTWKCEKTSPETKETYYYLFQENAVYIQSEGNQQKHVYNIDKFIYDSKRNKLYLALAAVPDLKTPALLAATLLNANISNKDNPTVVTAYRFAFNDLEFVDKDRLKGFENRETQITYTRTHRTDPTYPIKEK